MSSTTEPIRNKHGCLAPRGCYVMSDRPHPQVAVVANAAAGPFEATFLIKAGELEKFLFDVTDRSWTLKAWFAYRIREKILKDEHDLEYKLPPWQRVWGLVQQKRTHWASKYANRKMLGAHTTDWELEEPQSPLELFASALAVLAYNINDNTALDDGEVSGFRCHDYYYEDEGKFFALYHFMLCLKSMLAAGRINTIHMPCKPVNKEKWMESYGYKIRQASENFMTNTNWDPVQMLAASLQSGRASAPNTSKIVTFVYTQDSKMRVYKKSLAAIRHNARNTLRGTLRKLIGLEIKKVFISDGRNTPIKTYQELSRFAAASTDPVLWLRNDSAFITPPAPTPVETSSQRDYSSHAVLKLEQLIGRMDNETERCSAGARFRLVSENHIHSATLVEELKEGFSPLERATTARWQALSERKKLCEEAKNDHAKFDMLRRFVSDLNDEQQAHAQQYLALVNTSNPLAGLAAENLVKLLEPTDEAWEAVSEAKAIFDAVKKET